MADIILVMPRANRFDKIAIRVPNGLLAVAAIPDGAGYSVQIIDLKVDDNWKDTLKKAIGTETICVGITCSTGRMIHSALEVAKAVREINGELPIVWGGPHPTLLPEQTLQNPLVDIVVVNEGDKTLLELVEALSSKKSLSDIKGIGYKENGRTRVNDVTPLIKDLDSLPIFPYHLLDISKYSTLNINNLGSIDLLTSRGCSYKCAFCSVPLTSQRLWRGLSVDKILENIVFLQDKYDIKTFYFVDDNFMVDLKRVERLLDALNSADINIFWGTQGVHINTINQMSTQMLDKIERSGCVELSIGVESANSRILKMIDKKIDVKDVLDANDKLAGRNFAVKYNMIIGFPGETIDEIKNTVELTLKLADKNKNAWFPFNIFTPFPGTPMFIKAVKHGFKEPLKLEEWILLESTGWNKYYGHWMTDNENMLLESINCTSYFAFRAAMQRVSQPLLKMLLRIYQPIAYYRFKHMFYKCHIEKRIIQGLD
jgi:anaerobic magnesium-protoporphyrin IX monomethyl ester cyclase